ncbi:hypothetical protein GCM10007203_22860 [Staphylococcus nepalensis]|nr:hypothetical protein GCM10007203_22860 [Staphylococcus nepalensis]
MAIKLSSIDQFEQVLKENNYVFVLKHARFQQTRWINSTNFYMKEIWMAII